MDYMNYCHNVSFLKRLKLLFGIFMCNAPKDTIMQRISKVASLVQNPNYMIL